MKKIDGLVAGVALLVVAMFSVPHAFDGYQAFNARHGMITSFIKFALLVTFGEVLGLRIRSGGYPLQGFGLAPRAVVWGLLGLTIKLAFVIFSAGTPAFLLYMGWADANVPAPSAWSAHKVLLAFSISVAMNLVYAPVMMTVHKITDAHIVASQGAFSCLFKPIRIAEILARLDWNVQWNFVFKKTIPFFWIPAHTITFLLPPEAQVLFAAVLGVALGVILALASHWEAPASEAGGGNSFQAGDKRSR
jgi:hypothetical protein